MRVVAHSKDKARVGEEDSVGRTTGNLVNRAQSVKVDGDRVRH